MLLKKETNILQLEGKDLINKEFYEVKKNRKYNATLDYSLENIKIEQLAKEIEDLKKYNRWEKIFYQKDGKQFTNNIISLSFEYAEKEFNLISAKDSKYYVHKNSNINNIKDIKNINFENGLYILEEKIMAIQIDKSNKIEKNEFIELLIDEQIDLPVGFYMEVEEEYITFGVEKDKIKTVTKTEEIREKLYKDGFRVKFDKEIINFRRFKRSSGSSRDGKCLFIDTRLYNKIMEWSYMGLDISDNSIIDLAGMEAYISLTTSSIIDTIEIEPKNILLIDEYESTFTDTVMATRIKKINNRDRLVTKKEELQIKNNIWDGQSLLDSSLFKEKYKNKGMLLLRNRFFKSACFNTNIQKFFEDNGITDISQLNGKTIAKDIKDIKLITTKSSIKYLKYGSLENYIRQLDSTFGIVKYDKPTKFYNGYMVQAHYQLLNTIQLNNEQVSELMKDSVDYVRLLKDDIRVFREHLNIKIQDNIEAQEINSTDDMMFTMLHLNNKFKDTDVFTNFKADIVDNYVKNIKRGHVLINGNYSILFGNGLEMLKKSINKFDGESILGIDEVYSTNFAQNTRLLGCRSPHVTIGNLWLCKAVYKKEIEDYFNLSNEIVYVNSIKNNILERLNGSDFDSDQLILTDNKLLVDMVDENYKKFLVPTNFTSENIKKKDRQNTLEQKCQLDIKTSKNLIGEIINQSQILNSRLWDKIKKGAKDEEIQEIYTDICTLAIMSNIEIDKAKKEFPIDSEFELNIIKEKNKQIDKKTNKTIRPKFFKLVGEGQGYKFKKFETTMDYLQDIKFPRAERRDSKDCIELIQLLQKDIKLSDADRKQVKKLINETIGLKKQTNAIWAGNGETEEKYKKANKIKNEYIEYVTKLKIDKETIYKILKEVLNTTDKEKRGITRKILSILYKSHTKAFLDVFEDSKEKIERINRVYREISEDEKIEIIKLYGFNYAVIK